MTVRVTLLATLALLAGCSSADHMHGEFGAHGSLFLINGASVAGTVKVYLDGHNQGTLGVAQQYTNGDMPTGSHLLEVRLSNGSLGFSRQISLADHDMLTIIALDSSGVLRSTILADSNAVVPAGATKLRVAHYAQASSGIDIWRTQPDYGTPIRVQFPFNYQDVSPYLQSTVGNWEVMVSTPVVNPGDPIPDTLATTGVFPIPEGASRTVLVVDGSAGGVELLVVAP